MIGIICAEPEEIEAIASYMAETQKTKINSFEFILGKIENTKCVLVLSGVGKVNAAICTQTLILKFSPDVILNVGVAGGIGQNLKIGDIIIAENAIQHDFDVSVFPNRKKGQITGFSDVKIPCTPKIAEILIKCASKIPNIKNHSGTVLTGDQFINSIDKISKLQKEFGGIACEMEAGSIAQVCYINNIKFGIIKSISDLADNNSHVDFHKFIKDSSKSAGILLHKFIKSYQDLYPQT